MNVNIKKLKDILTAPTGLLLENRAGYLWVPSKKKLAVTLVAHVDTVFPTPLSKSDIKESYGVLMSANPSRGLGGDDRCGVYIAQHLCERLQCNLLLTDDEEVGCLGAYALAENGALCAEIEKRTQCLIEIDRRGTAQVVCYDCYGQSDALLGFVAARGFVEHRGSFSDVSVLAPAIKRQAVNVSAGYFEEHTNAEQIVLAAMEYTINRLTDIISEIHKTKHVFVRDADDSCDDAYPGCGLWGWGARGSKGTKKKGKNRKKGGNINVVKSAKDSAAVFAEEYEYPPMIDDGIGDICPDGCDLRFASELLRGDTFEVERGLWAVAEIVEHVRDVVEVFYTTLEGKEGFLMLAPSEFVTIATG